MKHIKDKALRLIDYLTELARLRSKIIREIRQYQSGGGGTFVPSVLDGLIDFMIGVVTCRD